MADKNFLTDIIDADLAEGKVQQIHTRFPPEPNGYLHIGSAKAIYINWSIANQYGGKFNLRLDDTNPAREGEEYVNSIIEDLHWLGADPNGGIFYGSDYFDSLCYTHWFFMLFSFLLRFSRQYTHLLSAVLQSHEEYHPRHAP